MSTFLFLCVILHYFSKESVLRWFIDMHIESVIVHP